MPFAPLVLKIRCHSPNKKGSAKANMNYLKYIATREGVDISNLTQDKNMYNIEHEDIMHNEADNELYLRYMAERPRSHGLLGNIDTSDLNKVANTISELTKNGKNIYRGIISLSEKDAEALGFTNREKWYDYLNRVMPDIAKELGLSINYSYVFAFHGEKTHPHIHFQLWDNTDKVKSPFIHTSVQNRIRKLLSEAMFNEEYENMIKEIYKSEREELNKIRNTSRTYLTNSVKDILDVLANVPGSTKEKLTTRISNHDLTKLSIEFKKLLSILPTKGSVDYAYLPKEVKEQVDKITDFILSKVDIKKEFTAYLNAVEEGQKLLGKTKFEINIEKEKAEKDIYKRIGNVISRKAKQCKELNLNLENIYDNISLNNDEENLFLNNPEIPDEIINLTLESDDFKMEFNDNYKLALKYLYDSEIQEFDKAKEILIEEAKNNNVLAIHDLGKIYERGLGVDQNKELANIFYEKSLKGFLSLENKKSDKYIEYRIGKLYASGKGIQQDLDKAIYWFDKSANKDYKYSQYSLAMLYLKGIYGSEKEEDSNVITNKILTLLHRSSEQNFAYAQYELARIYEKGVITEKNIDLSQKYYKLSLAGFLDMANDINDDNLIYRIGKMYYEGKGVEANLDKAIEYLEKSAKLNNSYAQYLLAKIYLELNDLIKINEAIQWLQKSAEKNNDNAMYTLGIIYMNDKYVNKDMNKAISYLSKAALNNNHFAQYQLGKIFYDGSSVNKDIDSAIKYFKMASEHENDFAYYYLGKIYSDKNLDVYNINEAIKWFEKAAKHENSYAQFQLGKIYLYGEIKNKELGLYYITRSAENGNEYAKEFLDSYNKKELELDKIIPSISFELYKSIFNILSYYKEKEKYSINDKKFRSRSKQAQKEEKRKQQVPGHMDEF